jgi:hypothetical protein
MGGSVAEGAPFPATADEVEPRGAVLHLNGRTPQPVPAPHRDSASRSLEHGEEVSLHIGVEAERSSERQELVTDRPVGSRPAQVEIADGDVASAAAGSEVVEDEAAAMSEDGQLPTSLRRPDHGRQRFHSLIVDPMKMRAVWDSNPRHED